MRDYCLISKLFEQITEHALVSVPYGNPGSHTHSVTDISVPVERVFRRGDLACALVVIDLVKNVEQFQLLQMQFYIGHETYAFQNSLMLAFYYVKVRHLLENFAIR